MLKRRGMVFVVTLFTLTLGAVLAAQENRGKSVPPSATATISPTDTARDTPPQPKPPQNEPMFRDPHNLPVPANVIGATLDPAAIGVSVKPVATVRFTMRDALASDARHPEFARRKKTENEAMVNESSRAAATSPARSCGRCN